MSRVASFSGSRLEQIRVGRRLTQHDLASELRQRGFGTTQATVSRWESGQNPNGAVLPALAEVLGVSIGELYGDADDDEESDPVADLFVSLRRFVRAEVEAARA